MKSVLLSSLLWLCIWQIGAMPFDPNAEPIVKIKLGSILGLKVVPPTGREYLSFRGIPYAEPPVGPLRFSDPVPKRKWSGVLNATIDAPNCIQYSYSLRVIRGVEDCLTLNVYTNIPQGSPALPLFAQLRPVMVFFHGGAFEAGGSSEVVQGYGPRYFLGRDVVLVTANYRVGPFGFLSTEDEESPGNYGLLDQTMVLEWVRDNILHFGGNPKQVTIFGESAGGGSVTHHMISPRSRGLFSRGISQSGASTCKWATSKNNKYYTHLLAESVGCQKESSRDLIHCLREKPALQIVNRTYIDLIGLFPIAFQPRVDRERRNPFIPDDPKVLLASGNFNKVPVIIGSVKDEGAVMTVDLLSNQGTFMKKLESNPNKYFRLIYGAELEASGSQLAQRAIDTYLQPGIPYIQQTKQLNKAFSASLLTKCIVETTQLLSQWVPTFSYLYSHRALISVPMLYGVKQDLGVCHGDELFMMFSNRYYTNFIPDDALVSKILLDFWTSFASGKFPYSDSSPIWLPTTKVREHHMVILPQSVLVNGSHPLEADIQLWNQIVREAGAESDQR